MLIHHDELSLQFGAQECACAPRLCVTWQSLDLFEDGFKFSVASLGGRFTL